MFTNRLVVFNKQLDHVDDADTLDGSHILPSTVLSLVVRTLVHNYNFLKSSKIVRVEWTWPQQTWLRGPPPLCRENFPATLTLIAGIYWQGTTEHSQFPCMHMPFVSVSVHLNAPPVLKRVAPQTMACISMDLQKKSFLLCSIWSPIMCFQHSSLSGNPWSSE